MTEGQGQARRRATVRQTLRPRALRAAARASTAECRTPALDDSLTRCRHAQRAVYNRTIDAVAPEGGRIPAKLKRPTDPDSLYGQLTEWRMAMPWMAAIPVALARPAVSQARTALNAHE